MDFYKILFVHGFGQKYKTYSPLMEYLKSLGFPVEPFFLPLTTSSFSSYEKMLEKKITEIDHNSTVPTELILIGFGLGGVLIKKILSKKAFGNLFIKVILISTPVKVPNLISKFSIFFKLISYVFKPLNLLLDDISLEARFPADIQCGIIRGTHSQSKIANFFLGEFNDGAFSKNDLTPYDEHLEILDIPLGRYELLNKVGTWEYIADFIKKGRFVY